MAAFDTFCRAIRVQRKAMKLTQEQVAARCGIAPRHYQSIEQGHCRPGFDIALRLSAVLHIDLNALSRQAEEEMGNL